jgi:Secretion system C-terminal sorting domain
MKKTLLLCGLIGCFLTTASAQLELTLQGTSTIVNGTVQNELISTTDFVYFDVVVKNTGATSQAFVVSRKLIDSPSATWADQVCWGNASGGTCVDTSSLGLLYNQNYPITLSNNQTAVLNAKVKPDPLSGAPATYRYYFGTQANLYMDSVDLTITSVLNVKEVKKDISLTVSPNPASDYVVVKVTNFEKGTLKIVDALGNIVMNESYNGSKSINVRDFKNGVYFIMISGEGMNPINRKLVVRH